jgi:hypothetical protein
LKLNDLVNRSSCPVPWEEGDNIPWSAPDFSRRMMKERLGRNHNAACGFTNVSFTPSLTGSDDDIHEGLFVITGQKQGD